MRLNVKATSLAGLLLVLPLFGAIVAAVLWVLWSVWCWVLPQVFPTGPAAFISPSFLLFCGMWLLVSAIAGFFKRS